MSDSKGKSVEEERRESVFFETGAYLSEEAYAAFLKGMREVKPTDALVSVMARAKSIRQA